MTTPSLAITLPTFAAEDPGGWEHLIARARAADDAGIGRVLVSDHVVFGEDLDAYGRAETGGVVGGRQPTGPDGHWLEPLTVLAHVSAITSRVRLGTNILLAALRRPVVLAKTTSTIDVLSGGRLDLGVGIGWQREEYEAAGLDYGDRGRLLDHSLAVLQTLWREQRASFADPDLTFEGIHMMPKPVLAGGVPIWVSGRLNDRVAQRLARFASGWIPWGEDAADPVESIPRMREAVAAAGGDASGFQVAGNLAVVRDGDAIELDATMEPVPALAAAGVTDFRVHLPLPADYDGAAAVLTDLVGAFDAARA